jgi:hypothetical protein
MDCTEFQSIVAGEREEDLSALESSGFEAHLESCGACRESVARAEEDLERLAHLADPPPLAAGAWARVDEAVRAQARGRPGREDPFAVEPARTQTAVLAPAMPVTLRSPAAQPVRRRRPLVALVAVAAGLVLMFAFSYSPNTEHAPIGPVKPFDPEAVTYQNTKVGEGIKKLKEQGHLLDIDVEGK